MTSNDSKHQPILLGAFSPEVVDAIRGAAREEARVVIGELRDELTELIKKQAENIQVAKASGKPEDAAVANAGTRVVQDADQAIQAAEADPTPDKAAEARDKVEEATQVVDETESELTGRVTRLERRLGSNNERDSFEDVRQRVYNLEEGHTALVADRDQLWTTVRAQASAIAIGDGSSGAKGVRAFLITYVVVAGLYVLAAWFTPVEYDWLVQIGLPAVIGSVIGSIIYLRASDRQVSAAANASASSHHGNQSYAQDDDHQDVGLGIMDPDPRTAASAHAGAAASHH